MKLEISTFKISQGDKVIELNPEEAKDLYSQLAKHFGLDFGCLTDFTTTVKTNDIKTGGYRGGSFSAKPRISQS